ncbi:Arb2 domain-containing protein [Podospora fimiseda]|uniref:Arb2 domain-containing protein n=1 Tax=Podospora fimiseda TaxID=252190 RepID=A0AAN7BWR2_9PEZI|nr:Arb2 domain-containing protein [Podospora fimiseda]
MFRRRWSGLPADPVYPTDLTELGYFINEDDEIRFRENPDYYFKFFSYKNERWNERQRFCFNEGVGKVIDSRLDDENLVELRLPIGTPPDQPHVPIRISADLPAHTTRVVLFIGQPIQEFGVLAYRVLSGRGGINKGSVINLVKALKNQKSSAEDDSPPGIIIANPGELIWWPEGKRGLTPTGFHGVPMASAVHFGRRWVEEENGIPGNMTSREHVKMVFEEVLGKMVKKGTKVDVIALGDSADDVEGYLNDDEAWAKFGGMMGSLVVMGGYYDKKQFKCEGFEKFMNERARAYVIHHTPLDSPVAGPGGNLRSRGISYGCPTYSAGAAKITEMLFIVTQPSVLKWIQDVALEGEAYKNKEFEVFGGEDDEEDDQTWRGWTGESDESKTLLPNGTDATDDNNSVLVDGVKDLGLEDK